MQKKCITFAAVNNFYSNEDEDSKEENTTATLCEAAHSHYRSVNECYPPPPLTFVYFCKGAVAGDAIAAALPLGRIFAAHRTDSNRSAVRRFCLNETRSSIAVETQISVRRQILLSYVAHKFICREKSIFPVCL